MARRINQAPFVRGSSPRRETVWVGSADESVTTALTGGAVVFDQQLTAGILALRSFTVIRTRGWVAVWSDQAAAFEVPFGGLGMAVVSDQAAAIGVTAVPTPITDEGSDLWFQYQHFICSGAGQAASQSNSGQIFPFDSKAMRKVEDGQDIVVTLENAAAAGIGLLYVVKFRMLLKLH